MPFASSWRSFWWDWAPLAAGGYLARLQLAGEIGLRHAVFRRAMRIQSDYPPGGAAAAAGGGSAGALQKSTLSTALGIDPAGGAPRAGTVRLWDSIVQTPGQGFDRAAPAGYCPAPRGGGRIGVPPAAASQAATILKNESNLLAVARAVGVNWSRGRWSAIREQPL